MSIESISQGSCLALCAWWSLLTTITSFSEPITHACIRLSFAGVRILRFTLGQEALHRHSQGAFHLKELSVDFISVELPSWRQPARVLVSGLKAELKQRQLPEVRTLYRCHSMPVPAQSTLKHQQSQVMSGIASRTACKGLAGRHA